MIVYHEANLKAVDSILEKGLKCTSRGDKGDDSVIMQTDKLLDDCRPEKLKQAGISRDNNLYAFIADNNKVISIVDGGAVRIGEFVEKSDQAVFRLTVDPKKCYVSDLDLFDATREAVEKDKSPTTLNKHAARYWNALTPLSNFKINTIKRPEVMVTYDISPESIEFLNRNR